MESKIKRMFLLDLIMIIAFLVFLWITLACIMISIISIMNTVLVKAAILSVGISVVFFASLTLLALVNHLRKNRNKLYMEEIKYLKNSKMLLINDEKS
jgi:hypothetical protein